jgi:hypothetical protein
MRFPGEDGGHSLAEMAQRDLDAALQLLADRAQYITGAGGAAIALRRNGKNDLLCRASAGTNAPELGALLSTEFGLSGESVRTRRALRCDDAERDARVNREVCRELGIASVVVMPVVDDDQVLGVFELFSGKAHAFGERDLSALQRLSEMVETAVRLARAAESLPDHLRTAEAPATEVATANTNEAYSVEAQDPVVEVEAVASAGELKSAGEAAAPVASTLIPTMPLAAPAQSLAAKTKPLSKPLFWSIALSATDEAQKLAEADRHDADRHGAGRPQEDQSHVPPVLRNLRKCEACGFPVSAGRTLCVECEEKKWRGQLAGGLPGGQFKGGQLKGGQVKPGQVQAQRPEPQPITRRTAEPPTSGPRASEPRTSEPRAFQPIPQPTTETETAAKPVSTRLVQASPADVQRNESKPVTDSTLPMPVLSKGEAASPAAIADAPDFVLSGGLEPAQSWLSSNKYVIAAILVACAVVAAIVLFR